MASIVVADDAPVVRMLCGELLLDAGLQVVASVATLGEAMAAVASLRPDALLLDLGLPDGGGIGAISGVHAVSSGTRVFILTGRSERGLREKALAAGAEDFFVKGHDEDAMVARIVAALRDHSR